MFVFRAAYSENRDGNFPRDVRVIRRITRHVAVYSGSLLVTDLSLFRFNEQELRRNGGDTHSFAGHFSYNNMHHFLGKLELCALADLITFHFNPGYLLSRCIYCILA